MKKIDLSKFNNSWYKCGKSPATVALWFFSNAIFLQNRFNPFSKIKTILLRLFGSKIGKGVVLKPSLNVKYPWNMKIGNFCWLGENVWLDSLGKISIGNHVCISQGTYLCTGNHDWNDSTFGLIIKPIIIEDGAWIGAHSIVLPGVTVSSHSVLTAGSVISQDTEPYMIYSGNPAVKIKERKIR